MALGEYYLFAGKLDSAVSCYNTILKRNDNMENVYDASKLLFKIYNKLGDTKPTCYYANVFVRASDTLNLGKRQLLAATANNLYQYHRDMKREKDIAERGEKYKTIALWSLSILVPLIIIVSILYLYKRHKAVMKILSQQQTLSSYNKEINRLKEEIDKQENNLQTHKSSLADTLAKLQVVTEETEHYKEKLAEQQKLLEEKIDQNRDLMRLMHKAEIEGSAEDIVNAVRQSSKGKAKMTDREWDMLIQAVDDLYPDFGSELTNRLGRIDISELRVCYLMLIGLTNPQICNVTNIPHSTVWRWSKRYEWILTWKGNQKKA